MRYVFRHRPLTGSDLALRAAELVERTRTTEEFWDAHVKLMTRSPMSWCPCSSRPPPADLTALQLGSI
ncbi:hypothetical protein AGR7A_pAt20174 [Agrobacterium deltaense NCPPB 1641]|uniref:Uncharacterized protein n=1 Tax=Agrobacterium deltaense NCPPB 1641 TaxID=1183425 RepID=A0A1S7U939_9HYPH|nr:hypothetical protein AGR7A_pAt20174 [Agrobacterium deltaense NCPPB 1641]